MNTDKRAILELMMSLAHAAPLRSPNHAAGIPITIIFPTLLDEGSNLEAGKRARNHQLRVKELCLGALYALPFLTRCD